METNHKNPIILLSVKPDSSSNYSSEPRIFRAQINIDRSDVTNTQVFVHDVFSAKTKSISGKTITESGNTNL